METIFGLLIVLLPLVFKAIEKKLQQSGKQEQAGKVREVADQIFGEDIAEPVEEPVFQTSTEEKPVVLQAKPLQVEPLRVEPLQAKPVQAPVRIRRTAMLMEEPPKKTKEKIDPKKLILYSEIMKPKYTE